MTCPSCGEDPGMTINNQPFCINCISQEMIHVTNMHNAQTDKWQQHNADVDPGPLCGVVFHAPDKPSTRPTVRLNYTTLTLLALAFFPMVYWLHGCAQ